MVMGVDLTLIVSRIGLRLDFMNRNELPFVGQTYSPEETLALASRFSSLVKAGDLILLHGGLGAGKTLFVRGLCAGLGLRDLWEVDSPTYTVVNHYEADLAVDHIDLYRLAGSADLDEIQFEDLLAAQTVKLIEWPERLVGYPLPEPDFLLRFAVCGEQRRTIRIEAGKE